MSLHKIYRLKPHEIAPIALGRGGCIASDRITVDGARVGYMYRDYPVEEEDSGWCFLAGDEDESYMEDTQRHGVFDVNTIVNYDPDILPYLDAEAGCRFVRDENGKFELFDELRGQRVDARTAALVEERAAEGRASPRRALKRAMWILVGATVLACASVIWIAS